jgi:hypothetical protein
MVQRLIKRKNGTPTEPLPRGESPRIQPTTDFADSGKTEFINAITEEDLKDR